MIDRIKSFFSGESYSPVTLFEVKNVIGGEGKINLPDGKETVKKSVEALVEVKKVKVPRKSRRKSVLSIMQEYDGPVNSTDILARCLSENICSRATFFRKMNKLVKEGKLKRSKKGKEVFYSTQ